MAFTRFKPTGRVTEADVVMMPSGKVTVMRAVPTSAMDMFEPTVSNSDVLYRREEMVVEIIVVVLLLKIQG